jgi:hypothetical protein
VSDGLLDDGGVAAEKRELSRLAPRPKALLEHGHAESRKGLLDMAADGDAKDFKAHLGTYAGFIALMKWGAVAAVLTGFIVILLIYK